jgi:3-isopropylmalate/(R)-2-methylmalate dehydratase large subunit
MGDSHAEVYLGSPYSVAAAALTGRIVDPRDLLSGSAA